MSRFIAKLFIGFAILAALALVVTVNLKAIPRNPLTGTDMVYRP